MFLSSCKTDPKSGDETIIDNKPFTVVSYLSADPEGLNPITATAVYSRSITNQLFSNLVHYDVQTLKASPMLIKEMPRIEVLDNNSEFPEYNLAMSFEILDEATWDNGQPITGHDVDFTLKVMLNPKVPADGLRPYVERMKHIEIDSSNPKKFTVYSDKYFLVDEIFTNFPILPKYAYDEKGLLDGVSMKELSDSKKRIALGKSNENLQNFATEFLSAKFSREKIVGSGPYELGEWVTGQRLVLKKKENWWGNKLGNKFPLLQAYPTEIVFKPIEDMTTAVTELKGGNVETMSVIGAKEFTDLQNNEPAKKTLNLHEYPSYGYFYIGINRKNPKLEDKKVRRALAHLINTKELIDVVMYGYGLPTTGPFNPTKPYYNKDLPLIQLDIEKAKTLLNEAGWTDSNNNGIVDKTIRGKKTEMNLNLLITKSASSEKIAQLMKDHAKKAGVNIDITVKDFNSWKTLMAERKYELAPGAFQQDPSLDDPKQLFHTSSDTPSGLNRWGFGNAESDKIIDEIQVTVDETKRNKLYKQFQEILYDDQPMIFLLVPKGRSAIHKKFDGKPSSRKPNIFENQFRLAKGEIDMN